MLRALAVAALVILLLDALAQAHVLGHAARQGELRELQRVGAVARGLTAGDELVGGGHAVVDHGGQLEQHVVLHSIHLGPVLDVGTIAQLNVGLGLVVAVIYAALIDLGVVLVGLVVVGVVNVGGSGDDASVSCGGSDRAGIHQGNQRDLTLAGLGTLAVGEVAGGVADRQTIVAGNVAGTEARTAEGRLDDRTGLEQLLDDALTNGCHIDGNRLGISAHGEVVVTDALAAHDARSSAQVVIGTARAAGDDTLVGLYLAVLHHLVNEVALHLVAKALLGVLLDLAQDLDGIGLQLVDGECVAGVVGQGDHTLLSAQVDLDHAVVVSHLTGLEHLEVLGTLVNLVVVLHLVVGNPDRAQAGGLGGHDVDTVTEVDGQVLHAGAGKLEDLVLNKAALERGLYQRDSNVVGTYALAGSTLEPNEDNLGSVDVPSVAQQLLHELTTAFAHAHVTERAVAGVAVATQDHVTALHHRLAGKLVDNGLVGGHVYAAVLLGCRQTEHVVILVDRAAHGTQRVVAVGHCIGQGELLETTGAGGLDNAHVGDVVRHHRVEADAHLLALAAVNIVTAQDAVGDGVLTGLVRRGKTGGISANFVTVD